MLATTTTVMIPTNGYAPTGPQDDGDEKLWGTDPGPQDDDCPRSVVGPGVEDDDSAPFLMSSGFWLGVDPLPGPSPEDNDGRPRMGNGTANDDDDGEEHSYRRTFMGIGPNDDETSSKESEDALGDWTGLLAA